MIMAEVTLGHRAIALDTWKRSNDPASADFGPELLAQALADLEAAAYQRGLEAGRSEGAEPWELLAEWGNQRGRSVSVPYVNIHKRWVCVAGDETADESWAETGLTPSAALLGLCAKLGLTKGADRG